MMVPTLYRFLLKDLAPSKIRTITRHRRQKRPFEILGVAKQQVGAEAGCIAPKTIDLNQPTAPVVRRYSAKVFPAYAKMHSPTSFDAFVKQISSRRFCHADQWHGISYKAYAIERSSCAMLAAEPQNIHVSYKER